MPPTPPTAARPADVQATFGATLVDEWVRAGLTARRGVPRVALDPAGARPGGRGRRGPAPGRRPPRRAVGRVRGARRGVGHRASRARPDHQRHRGRRAASGDRRGRSRRGSPARVHGGPPARAARRRGPAGDRPGAPLRPIGALVRRPGRARRGGLRSLAGVAARAVAATGAPGRARSTSTCRSASRWSVGPASCPPAARTADPGPSRCRRTRRPGDLASRLAGRRGLVLAGAWTEGGAPTGGNDGNRATTATATTTGPATGPTATRCTPLPSRSGGRSWPSRALRPGGPPTRWCRTSTPSCASHGGT